MSNWPFNADLPRNKWTEIQADGFDPLRAHLPPQQPDARLRAHFAARHGHIV